MGKKDSKVGLRITSGEFLRCDGPGTLRAARLTEGDQPVLVRSVPLSANGTASAQALKSLPRHVSLARALEIEERESSVEFTLEEPAGKPLSETIEHPMALTETLMLGAELASALAVLHQHGLFHGELSPESVRIQENGKAVLWNFPLLLVNRLSDRRRNDRETLGLWTTAPFFSPERAQGAPLAPAADIFALGALLCRAGGGAGPRQLSTLETLNAIATGKWRPKVPSAFPRRVKQLVARMTHPDPLERPHASVVAHCLCVAQRPEPAGRGLWDVASLGQAWALPVRERAPAALLVALAMAAGAYWFGGERAETRAPEPRAELAVSAAEATPHPAEPVGWCGSATPQPSTKVEPKQAVATRSGKPRAHASKKAAEKSAGLFSRLFAFVGGK